MSFVLRSFDSNTKSAINAITIAIAAAYLGRDHAIYRLKFAKLSEDNELVVGYDVCKTILYSGTQVIVAKDVAISSKITTGTSYFLVGMLHACLIEKNPVALQFVEEQYDQYKMIYNYVDEYLEMLNQNATGAILPRDFKTIILGSIDTYNKSLCKTNESFKIHLNDEESWKAFDRVARVCLHPLLENHKFPPVENRKVAASAGEFDFKLSYHRYLFNCSNPELYRSMQNYCNECIAKSAATAKKSSTTTSKKKEKEAESNANKVPDTANIDLELEEAGTGEQQW